MAPLLIEQLAATVGGQVVFFKDYDTHIRIEMSDGRSYYFRRLHGNKPRAAEVAADFKEGVMTAGPREGMPAPNTPKRQASKQAPTAHRKKAAETGEE